MDLNFETLYKEPVIALRLNRSHPYIKRDLKWFIQFNILHGIYTSIFAIVVHNVLCYNIKSGNYIEAYSNGILCVIYCVITFKYVCLLFYQSKIKHLIEVVQSDYDAAKYLPEDDKKVIWIYIKKAQFITKCWSYFCVLCSLTFPLKSVFLMSLYGYKGEFRLVQLYDLIYPDFIERVKDGIVSYLIIFMFLVSYIVYSVTMYIGYTLLGPIFILHACGQLELAKHRLLNMFPKDGIYDPVATKQKLKCFVVHMQNIYDFVEDINYSFKLLYEMVLKATALIIPILSLQILEAMKEGILSMEFIGILIGAFLISSIPCYYGNLLVEKGEEVRQAVYACGWQNHADNRMRSTVLLIITRCSRPVVLRAILCCVSLEALADVFHLAYALFNVINAAW